MNITPLHCKWVTLASGNLNFLLTQLIIWNKTRRNIKRSFSDIYFRIWAVNRAAVHKNKDQNIMIDELEPYFVSWWLGIPHFILCKLAHISLHCLPLSVDASEVKEWRCNTSVEKLSTHFRSLLGPTIYFYRKTSLQISLFIFLERSLNKSISHFVLLAIFFSCFLFWMCQIFYRRANNITISEALYSWYPGDSAPLLSSDWSMFWVLASHWSALTIGSLETRDLRGSKTFETDLLLLFPELHKAQNNRQVSEVNKKKTQERINKKRFFSSFFKAIHVCCIFWDILNWLMQNKESWVKDFSKVLKGE